MMLPPSRRTVPSHRDAFGPSSGEVAVWALVWVVVALKVMETLLAHVSFGAGATIALFVTLGLPFGLLRHLRGMHRPGGDEGHDPCGQPYR